jgi:hypothetical protein
MEGELLLPAVRHQLMIGCGGLVTKDGKVDLRVRECRFSSRRGPLAVTTRRSPDASTSSAMLRPNPLALPVTNQTFDMKILYRAS